MARLFLVPADRPTREDNGRGEHVDCGHPLVRAMVHGDLDRPLCVECDADLVVKMHEATCEWCFEDLSVYEDGEWVWPGEPVIAVGQIRDDEMSLDGFRNACALHMDPSMRGPARLDTATANAVRNHVAENE